MKNVTLKVSSLLMSLFSFPIQNQSRRKMKLRFFSCTKLLIFHHFLKRDDANFNVMILQFLHLTILTENVTLCSKNLPTKKL